MRTINDPNFDAKAFVACAAAGQVAAVDLKTDKLLALLDVAQAPLDLALKPDGGELFVCNFASHNVSIIETTSNEVASTFLAGTNPTHAAYWSEKFPDAVKSFKKIFVSSSIGLRKPDAEAFAFVVREIGVPAKRIVFFDDSPHNIEGARACGLQTVLVNSRSDVVAALAALGLIG